MQIRSSSSSSLVFGLNSSVAILQSYNNVIPDWQYYPTVHIVAAVLVVA